MKKRFLKSDAYQKAIDNGKFIITEYATPGSTDPSKSAVSKLVRTPPFPENRLSVRRVKYCYSLTGIVFSQVKIRRFKYLGSCQIFQGILEILMWWRRALGKRDNDDHQLVVDVLHRTWRDDRQWRLQRLRLPFASPDLRRSNWDLSPAAHRSGNVRDGPEEDRSVVGSQRRRGQAGLVNQRSII